MARATRGREIRRLKVSALAPTVSIPAELKNMFADGYDAAVVVEVGRPKIRAALAISSGTELVVPDWLQELIREKAKEQKIDEFTIFLSTRKIWLVAGEQDDAIKDLWARQTGLPAWDRLSREERRAVALRWLADELASTNPANARTP